MVVTQWRRARPSLILALPLHILLVNTETFVVCCFWEISFCAGGLTCYVSLCVVTCTIVDWVICVLIWLLILMPPDVVATFVLDEALVLCMCWICSNISYRLSLLSLLSLINDWLLLWLAVCTSSWLIVSLIWSCAFEIGYAKFADQLTLIVALRVTYCQLTLNCFLVAPMNSLWFPLIFFLTLSYWTIWVCAKIGLLVGFQYWHNCLASCTLLCLEFPLCCLALMIWWIISSLISPVDCP
jgi:hypothetical protein